MIPRQGLSFQALLFLVGIIFTSVSIFVAWHKAVKNEKELFLADTAAVTNQLSQRISALEEVVTSLATLVNSAPHINADQFRVFSEAILSRHPYLSFTAYMPLVEGPERLRFETERHERGFITEATAMAYASHKAVVGRGVDSVKSARGESTSDIENLEVDMGYGKRR